MKIIFALGIILSITTTSISQAPSTQNAINVISKSKEHIHIFGKHATSKFISIEKPHNKHIQYLIKSDSALYCLIDGTGKLYKYSEAENQFYRIDSTIFWGYNLGAFTFSYNNDIYNLGGSGLWRSNGHLRKYNNAAHEWDIVPLNLEIPIISTDKEGMVYYDQLDGKIYSAYTHSVNDGIKAESDKTGFEFEIMVLDLKTNTWNNIGLLNKNLVGGIQNEYNVATTPFGLLTLGNSNLNLWDFKNNKHYQLKNKDGIYQTIKRGIDTTLVFYKANKLFLGREFNQLDSINLTIDDFKQIGTIYSTPFFTKIYPYRKVILSLIFTLFVIGIYYAHLFYKRLLISKYAAKSLAENEESHKGIQIFKEQELLLLNLLIANSKVGVKTSLEEINSALGLNTRSLETQKSQRHKVITSINKNYEAKTGRKLIQNDKLDFDRRSNVYFISKDELITLYKYLPE